MGLTVRSGRGRSTESWGLGLWVGLTVRNGRGLGRDLGRGRSTE